MRPLTLPSVLLFLAAASVRGEPVGVDIWAWARTGTGETPEGWTVLGVDEYADRGVRLNTQDEYALSPVYPGCVTQLVLTVRASSETTSCFLSAVPEEAASGARTLTAVATGSYVEQRLAWRADEKVRRFRFRNIGKGNAGWGIRALTVYLDRVEAPRSLKTERYSNALTVVWQADPRAVVNELVVDRVETFPPSYRSLREWSFISLTNGVGNTRDLAYLDPTESLTDVSGTNLCLQAWTGGHLQVGKSKVAGMMVLPLEAAVGRLALMTLFRHATDSDGEVTVGCIGEGGEAYDVAHPVLTGEPKTCAVSLPDGACSLVLHSRTTRRIRVRDIRIVTDYLVGHAVTNTVFTHLTRANACTAKNLRSGEHHWRLRSFDGQGASSAWSSDTSVTLMPNDGRYPQGFCIRLR